MTRAWCWRWASSMACWICTFGSAYSSTFEENSAIKYFQALVNGFAMTSVLSHPLAADGGRWSSIVAGAGRGFHLRSVSSGGIPASPGSRPRPVPGLARPALAPGRRRSRSLQCVRYIPCMARGWRGGRRSRVTSRTINRATETDQERRSRKRSRRTRVARHASTDGTRRGIAAWPLITAAVVVVVVLAASSVTC